MIDPRTPQTDRLVHDVCSVAMACVVCLMFICVADCSLIPVENHGNRWECAIQ